MRKDYYESKGMKDLYSEKLNRIECMSIAIRHFAPSFRSPILMNREGLNAVAIESGFSIRGEGAVFSYTSPCDFGALVDGQVNKMRGGSFLMSTISGILNGLPNLCGGLTMGYLQGLYGDDADADDYFKTGKYARVMHPYILPGPGTNSSLRLLGEPNVLLLTHYHTPKKATPGRLEVLGAHTQEDMNAKTGKSKWWIFNGPLCEPEKVSLDLARIAAEKAHGQLQIDNAFAQFIGLRNAAVHRAALERIEDDMTPGDKTLRDYIIK
jgi:hypothetical protein